MERYVAVSKDGGMYIYIFCVLGWRIVGPSKTTRWDGVDVIC